jgi:SAM-dependent methyltransferase
MLFGTREAFDYLHCPACGVLWLRNPPEDLSAYYPPGYYIEPPPPATRRLPALMRWLHQEAAARRLFGGHRLAAALARKVGPPLAADVAAVRPMIRASGLRSFDDPILDVGCGPVPERLHQLAQAGFRRLLGIDPMIPASLVNGGIPVQRQALDEVAGPFALIMFHHSFEHVPDPRATLRAAAERLRPGGAILIRTPVMGTWFWETYGTSWWELDAPRHLFVHTPRSLELLGTEAGLELRDVEYDSTYLEIVASEQIARDIAWRDPASRWRDLDAPELAASVRSARETVRQLNAAGRGGRAAFLFRQPGGGQAGARPVSPPPSRRGRRERRGRVRRSEGQPR